MQGDDEALREQLIERLVRLELAKGLGVRILPDEPAGRSVPPKPFDLFSQVRSLLQFDGGLVRVGSRPLPACEDDAGPEPIVWAGEPLYSTELVSDTRRTCHYVTFALTSPYSFVWYVAVQFLKAREVIGAPIFSPCYMKVVLTPTPRPDSDVLFSSAYCFVPNTNGLQAFSLPVSTPFCRYLHVVLSLPRHRNPETGDYTIRIAESAGRPGEPPDADEPQVLDDSNAMIGGGAGSPSACGVFGVALDDFAVVLARALQFSRLSSQVTRTSILQASPSRTRRVLELETSSLAALQSRQGTAPEAAGPGDARPGTSSGATAGAGSGDHLGLREDGNAQFRQSAAGAQLGTGIGDAPLADGSPLVSPSSSSASRSATGGTEAPAQAPTLGLAGMPASAPSCLPLRSGEYWPRYETTSLVCLKRAIRLVSTEAGQYQNRRQKYESLKINRAGINELSVVSSEQFRAKWLTE